MKLPDEMKAKIVKLVDSHPEMFMYLLARDDEGYTEILEQAEDIVIRCGYDRYDRNSVSGFDLPEARFALDWEESRGALAKELEAMVYPWTAKETVK